MKRVTLDQRHTDLTQQIASIQRQVTNLTALQDLARALTAELDLQRLLRRIIGSAADMVGAEASSLLQVDEDKGELVFWTIHRGGGPALLSQRMPLNLGIAGWVATHGQPLIVNDVYSDARFARAIAQKITSDTGFYTRAILCVPLFARERVIGVIEVLNKRSGGDFTVEDQDLLMALASYAAIAIENARLYQAVYDGYVDTMRALAATIDAKDPYTRGHSERVTAYAQRTAQAMAAISERDLEHLKYAAILHDIGKIGVDERILRKPGHLTPPEKAIMDGHPAIGASIVQGVAFLKEALPAIRHHHERYDGQGYPSGLRGADIPLGARILAVADSYDAMTTRRPYRQLMSQEQALEEIGRCSGSQFDPETAAAFVEQMRRFERGPG